jgi:hypothetical protein
MIHLKIHDINEGHCQITYKTKNKDNQTIYYALQDNGDLHGGVRLLRCTQEGEPSHVVSFSIPVAFERPINDSRLSHKVIEWLDRYGYQDIKSLGNNA